MMRLVAMVMLVLIGAAIGDGAPARAAGSGGGDGPAYVRLKPISFSVIGPRNKITKEVSVMLVLEMEPGKIEANLDAFKPQLYDRLLVSLSDAFDNAGDGETIGVQSLKDQLFQTVTDVVGPGLIHSVLVAALSERKHPN